MYVIGSRKKKVRKRWDERQARFKVQNAFRHHEALEWKKYSYRIEDFVLIHYVLYPEPFQLSFLEQPPSP
jgi:hypothetical protein